MGTLRLLTTPQSTRSQRLIWWFFLALLAFLLYVGILELTTPVHGASTHGCAPGVPPPAANAIPLPAKPESVLINEVLSNPKSNWNCSEAKTTFSQSDDSWVEFYNPQSQTFDLYAARAQISLDGGATYMRFTFGTAIAAGGLLVIFPLYNQTIQTIAPSPWHIILKVDTTIINQVQTPLLQPDQSYARVPDGSQNWLDTGNPTIDASNNSVTLPSTPTLRATNSPASKTPGQPASSGTQPTWGKLQLPHDATTPPDLTSSIGPAGPALSQPPAALTTDNGPGGWLTTLLISLALLLVASLIWCWRLFHVP
ncbi:MAG TPA: hypothetical protein VGD98_18030 [Ktedonobacteraceae bacterium]